MPELPSVSAPATAWLGRQKPTSRLSPQTRIAESVMAPCIIANIRAVPSRPIGCSSRWRISASPTIVAELLLKNWAVAVWAGVRSADDTEPSRRTSS